MYLSRGTRWFLRLSTLVTLAFIYVPLLVILLYAFNSRRVQTWPIGGLTTDWFTKAWHNHGARAGAGNDGGRGRLALQLLRARVGLVPRDPPDRAAGHRHGHGAELDVHAGAQHRPD